MSLSDPSTRVSLIPDIRQSPPVLSPQGAGVLPHPVREGSQLGHHTAGCWEPG